MTVEVRGTAPAVLARKVIGRLDRMVGISREAVRLYRIGRADPRPSVPAPEAVRWEWLEPARMHRLAEVYPLPEDLDERLDRRDACLGASIDGRLAFYGWVQTRGTHPMTHAATERPVRPCECWIYNCRTAEWARGRGVYPAALARMLDEQFASGVQVAWIYASAWNAPSLKGIERAGFCAVETLRSVRVGTHYFKFKA